VVRAGDPPSLNASSSRASSRCTSSRFDSSHWLSTTPSNSAAAGVVYADGCSSSLSVEPRQPAVAASAAPAEANTDRLEVRVGLSSIRSRVAAGPR